MRRGRGGARPRTALAMRSRIVLACADGESNTEVAARLGVHRNTVGKWRRRFVEFRLDGLLDEPRPGQPRKITDAQVEEVITKTLESAPKDATHWSTRSMAAEVGLTQTAVSRIWRAFGLQPHRQETLEAVARTRCSSRRSATSSGSTSTRPSARWCCAWTRSPRSRRWIAPRRSCRCCPARPSARPTTTSATAPPASTPRWTSPPARSSARCTHATARSSSRSSCRRIDREVPAELDVHLVLDNASTHKTPAIKRWLLAHPRFVLHFTPTSRSWLNLVERWFAELTTKKLQRGSAPLRPRAQHRHPRLDRDLERRPQALRLDQDRRPDPRIHQPLLHNESTTQDTSTWGALRGLKHCSIGVPQAWSARKDSLITRKVRACGPRSLVDRGIDEPDGGTNPPQRSPEDRHSSGL